MELSEKAKAIFSQADKWTFAGDCLLLDWMEEIAEGIEKRATATNNGLDQLSTTLKQTATALDNVTNSLSALQYTQFVENRCHDDDDTIVNAAEVPINLANDNQKPEDANKLWTKFMKRNLEVLHNSHERYSLDFEDSDEEDKTQNFIYQAKNPYNERLLPHIYGSSLWKENWHVGLCDGSNEYSDNEISEAFSDSSSITSPEENEYCESFVADNVSEWASSNSITNEKSPPHMKIQNASSLRYSESLFPEDTVKRVDQTAGGSSTSSSTSRNTLSQITTAYEKNQPRYDLFATIPDTPPTPTSSSSSLHQQSFSSAQLNTNISTDFLNQTIEPIPNSTQVDAQPNKNQILRRPVNLFDDDDFDNFMTEIVDKVSQKQVAEPMIPPVPAARKQNSINSGIKINEKGENNTTKNLFVEQSSSDEKHLIANVSKLPKSKETIESRESENKVKLNLFDDASLDLFSPKTDSPTAMPEDASVNVKNVTGSSSSITAKLLFDDDEDDDFLSIFATKKQKIKSFEKTKLFSNDEPNPAKKEDLRESIEDISKDNLSIVAPVKSIELSKEANAFNYAGFKHLDVDHDMFVENNTPQESSSNVQKANIPKKNFNKLADVQSTTVSVQKLDKPNESIQTKNANEQSIKDNLMNKVSLFDDENDSDGDIFGKPVKIKRLITSSKDDFFIETIDNLTAENSKVNAKEYSKNTSDATSEVNVLKQVDESFLEIQGVRDEKPKHSNQSIASKDLDTIEDEASNLTKPFSSTSVDNISVQKTSITFDENFKELNQNLENPFKKKERIDKVPEIPQQRNHETISEFLQSLDDDEPQKKSQPFEDNETAGSENVASSLENKATPKAYASLFLDEPPEDDDLFFPSLDNNALSASKYSNELENDFYEPALPKPPTDVTNPTKVTIAGATYSSVGLFSDIPPDDDDFSIVNDSRSSSKITKRIHSVFYDDFNETMAAVKSKPLEESTNLHSIFNDEPPPDDDDFARLLQSYSKEENDKITGVANDNEKSISHDMLDNDKPSLTNEIVQYIEESTKVKNISKLKMPMININVEALMPQSTIKKAFEQSVVEPKDVQITESSQIKDNSITAIFSPARTPNPTNENILVSICKNRVRIPAKRRPSTRRARHENYRKSIVAEQNEKEESTEDETADVFTNKNVEDLISREPAAYVPLHLETAEEMNKNRNLLAAVTGYNLEKGKTPETAKGSTKFDSIPKTSKALFDDFASDGSEDFLFGDKIKNRFDPSQNEATINTKSTVVADLIEKASKSKTLEKIGDFVIAKKPAPNKIISNSLFTEDNESDSDDLFGTKTVKQTQDTSNVSQSVEANKIISLPKAKSLFSSDEDYDEQEINQPKIASKKLKQTRTLLKKSPESKGLFSDSDDDDDSLFGSSSVIKKVTAGKSSVSHAKPLQSSSSSKQEPIASKSTSSNIHDNPLADLLKN